VWTPGPKRRRRRNKESLSQNIYEKFFQIVEDSDVLVLEDESFLSQRSRAGQGIP
jgi:hypothetical protein